MSSMGKRALALVLACILALPLAGCSMWGSNAYRKRSVSTTATRIVGGTDASDSGRVVSWSPGGNIKLLLRGDNNIYISDEQGERLIYRNYERDHELFDNPYSLWSFDLFRIQWSSDGRYIYIIDSIYDVGDDKLIPLKDCLVFSWVGNRGIYLSGGKIVEGKFWDNGFYGFYASKSIKSFENGEVTTIRERVDDKYFIVAERSWDENKSSLFKCVGPAVEVKTARFRFDDEEMYDRLLKAYQRLREDEGAWKLLNGEYREEESRQKVLREFEKLRSEYPVKLNEELFYGDHLYWDYDMDFYLVDIKTEKLS